MSQTARFNESIQRLYEISHISPSLASEINERVRRLVFRIKNPSSNPYFHEIHGNDGSMETARSQNELERKRVGERLKGFQSRDSPAWKEICRRFGSDLNQTELLSIAEVLSANLGLKIDREAKRRKEVLIKWFDENLPVIQPMLNKIVVVFTDGVQKGGTNIHM